MDPFEEYDRITAAKSRATSSTNEFKVSSLDGVADPVPLWEDVVVVGETSLEFDCGAVLASIQLVDWALLSELPMASILALNASTAAV
jgi:hypothetical protein